MKIFIQIASYRDPDLKNTIEDLINNSSCADNLSFGICWQHSEEDLWDNIYEYRDRSNFRIIDVNYSESKGACWARNLTQSLYNGEDFTLQIDSHTRSEKDWDNKILSLYKDLEDDMAIFTSYPSMFQPGQTYDEYDKRVFGCHVYGMENGLINSRPRSLDNNTRPMRAVGLAAGFIFGPGRIIKDVPYDPDFYFSGEEAALAIRYYTHGYNLYHPNINLFYHFYTRKEQKKHWSDHKDWHKYSAVARKRLECLLGRNNDFDLSVYGLGKTRSIEDWKEYSGIDYINKKIHKHLVENKEPPYEQDDNLYI
jgi:hypothetical protein